MAYATQDDLAGYADRIPSTVAVLLDRASRDVDQALLCARYDPADPAVKAALTAATCEQAAGYIAEGKLTGQARGIAQFTIGRLSATRAQAGAREAPQMVGDLYRQAWAVLQQAGLTGDSPREPGWCGDAMG